jgi:hypothetical protein
MTDTESPRGNLIRTPTPLSPRLNKRLTSYVTAASAAGVGMLAGAQRADAEVVYTPANTPILINTPVALDLNNDGTTDFELSNNYLAGLAKSCTICSFFEHASLKVSPAQAGNAIWAITSASHHSSQARRKNKKKAKNLIEPVAAPVFWGVIMGHGRPVETTPLVMDSQNDRFSYSDHYSSNSIGAWGKGRHFAGSYLGLKFTVGSEVHYGWARVEVHASGLTITATLTGYAYETVANRPIITGLTHGTFDMSGEMDPAALQQAPVSTPGTLGQLALGAAGATARHETQTLAQVAEPATSK